MKKYVAEFLGTTFLLMIVVGSGIMGEKLSAGNAAIALLANSIATGAGLYVLIQCLGAISGAHMNPVVSATEFLWGRLNGKDFVGYISAQILGAIAGTFLAHVMFSLPIVEVSQKHRESPALFISEFIATFGLICVIAIPGRKHVEAIPTTIAMYITSAYWFTSSTSFANPAVTIARSLTNTFSGIAPAGILGFIIAQILGSLAAYAVARKMISSK